MRDAPHLHAETREAWRAWLAEHHATASGVWLITWKKASGRPAPGYAATVEEALCVGWIDSTSRRIDDERSMQYFAPRKPRSGWSLPNKERIARLEAAGLMLPAGQAVVDAARADGSWTLLDDVEALVVPDDFRAALDTHPPAAVHWDAFPRSAKRAVLVWIVLAKRPETRARRVEEAARLAARNERANS